MKTEIPVEQLLRWRLARAEAEAPRAPSGARLLEMVRPWWETWPERFQELVERLSRVQIVYGHAMAESGTARTGYPVRAILLQNQAEVESSVRVLYFSVRDGRLRFRFQPGLEAGSLPESVEATFVSDKAQPLFSAEASRSVDREYRVDAELSPELAQQWNTLKVTDRMPFSLILRAGTDLR